MNKNWIRSSVLLLSIGLLASCGTSRKTAAPKDKAVKTTRKPRKGTPKKDSTAAVVFGNGFLKAEDLSLAERLNAKATMIADFRTFSGKAKAHLDREGESNEFSANIRVRHSEAIWINISALGGLVNVARLYITPDSVRMVNFLQKSARLLPFAAAGNLLPFPVSFEDLEALLVGYAPAGAQVQPRGIQALADRLVVSNTTTGGDQSYSFSLPDTVLSGYDISRMANADEKITLAMLLRGLSKEGGFAFFKDRNATWQSAGKSGQLQLNFETPQWNSDLSMPFSVPKNYDLD